jgi:hypothetical protein
MTSESLHDIRKNVTNCALIAAAATGAQQQPVARVAGTNIAGHVTVANTGGVGQAEVRLGGSHEQPVQGSGHGKRWAGLR